MVCYFFISSISSVFLARPILGSMYFMELSCSSLDMAMPGPTGRSVALQRSLSELRSIARKTHTGIETVLPLTSTSAAFVRSMALEMPSA